MYCCTLGEIDLFGSRPVGIVLLTSSPKVPLYFTFVFSHVFVTGTVKHSKYVCDPNWNSIGCFTLMLLLSLSIHLDVA